MTRWKNSVGGGRVGLMTRGRGRRDGFATE